MKKIVLFILLMLPVAVFGQKNVSQAKKEIQNYTDSLSDDQKEALFALTEEVFLISVDSLIANGQYLDAVELMDSIEYNWKYLTGYNPSERFYMTKTNTLQYLEEWQKMVDTVIKYNELYRENFRKDVAGLMYRMQGIAYYNLDQYVNSIKAYEKGMYYEDKIENQAECYLSMGHCYAALGKHTLTAKFYKKGFDLYLKYFGTTRSAILRNNFYIQEKYKKLVLDCYASHLIKLAIYEQDYGTRQAMKEYLLMAAHCGSDFAKEEYERIFGRYY